jgi:eukaryotic-like serine/threonine-protein kinase
MAAPDEMPDEEPPLFSEGDLVGGRYVLVRELGAGAAGQVWEAEHRLLTSRCAIKFLVTAARMEPESADVLVQRFRFEAQISARLGNITQHIVAAQDAGMFRGVPYLVMELVAGQNLDARIDVSEMSVEETADLLEQLAEPIDGAHGHGIAHRDVKPANIMVVRNTGGKPFYKLGDFGTAKYFGEGLVGLSPPKQTSENTLVGSPAYMSPEYVSGAPIVSGHIDLWALSVTAYEAITRQLPFDGELWTHVAMALLKGDFTPPSKVIAGLPPGIDGVFKRAFASDATARYQTARELAVAFRQAIIETTLVIAPAEPLPQAKREASAPDLGDLRVPEQKTPLLEDAMTPGPLSEPHAFLESLAPPPPRRKAFGLMLGAGAVGAVAIGLFAWLALRGEPKPAPASALAQTQAQPRSAEPTATETVTVAAPPIETAAHSASAKIKRPATSKASAKQSAVVTTPATTPVPATAKTATSGRSASPSETH